MPLRTASRIQRIFSSVASAVAVGGIFVALGFRVWISGVCMALCVFVAGTEI